MISKETYKVMVKSDKQIISNLKRQITFNENKIRELKREISRLNVELFNKSTQIYNLKSKKFLSDNWWKFWK